ncbi:hypothetical protein ALC60_04239 [Trachymyrmex zeteki]|uniref:Uncharacterized protein n=1 Tax=Mycetomoellerius zeteki TaxID=64791 RepID=A0A151X8J4_9HYME|nr:hypothetical protein ALC60_04239 [Trachymyrmex zeteki]
MASLRNDKLSRGEESGERPRTRNAGRRRGGRSSTQTRTRNVKPAQRPRSPTSSRCNDAAYQRMLNVHFLNSDFTFPLIT